MEGKKISFGFMKTKKVDKPVKADESREYIECVEEKSIKVIGGEAVEEEKPLIIPMKPNTLVTVDRLKQIAEEVEKGIEDIPIGQDKEESPSNPTGNFQPLGNETLDQLAVKELLQEAKKEVKVETAALTVPVPDKTVIDGQKESTLEDYEAIPVQKFGMAMLRGMGWAPGQEQKKYKQPEFRPKGLGLGADKVIKENQKAAAAAQKKDGEELSIVKNAFVKVVTGKQSGCYGKVVSLDEDTGRVVVELPLKKQTVSLSEFMLQPVTKAEYDKQSRVLNADAYEEYKKSDRSSVKAVQRQQKEPSSSYQSAIKVGNCNKNKEYKRNDDSLTDKYQRSRRNSSSSEEKHKRDDKERKYRRNSTDREENYRKEIRDKDRNRDQLQREKSSRRKERKYSSDSSDSEKKQIGRRDRNREHKEKTSKRTETNNSSNSSDSEIKQSRRKYSTDSEDNRRHVKEKRDKDIDKKRKGKKKKRDRDRSPNYKKTRK